MPWQQPGIAGKTFAQEAAESARQYAHIFSSSVPQRPTHSMRRDSGRPLGPQSYHAAAPPWIHDARRAGSAFASRTQKSAQKSRVLTSDVDYLPTTEGVDLVDKTRAIAPGLKTLPWSRAPDARPPTFPVTEPVDVFYGEDFGPKKSLAGEVNENGRKYAAVFQSTEPRSRPLSETTPKTLGPGVYHDGAAVSAIQVFDGKRPSAAFKTHVASSFVPLGQAEPPDCIYSPFLANEAKKWTSKGYAFSTRERFPRVRPRWQT